METVEAVRVWKSWSTDKGMDNFTDISTMKMSVGYGTIFAGRWVKFAAKIFPNTV
jgi:hypothetical protein